jgi:hypothetical protein
MGGYRQLRQHLKWLHITLLAAMVSAEALTAAVPLKLFRSVQQRPGAVLASADMPDGTLLPPSDIVSGTKVVYLVCSRSLIFSFLSTPLIWLVMEYQVE